ncbi:MAG: RNA methyltransferase [Bacteroidales bacterium]|nr:RNA methyltransferase [Bacteroidales bacterium]
MSKEQKKILQEKLFEFISDGKKNLFANIIKYRTRYLTLVLEDIYQPQNASAVLRTADCFGLQDVHIIENRNEFELNPEVVLGASKWLSIHRYNQSENNTLNAIQNLKSQGYRLVATMPHSKDILLPDLQMDQKTALFFGTERLGLSKVVQEHADAFVKIPMYGFTESYNISVAAAICVQDLTSKFRKSSIPWQLTEEEEVDVKLTWARSIIRNTELIEQKLFS